VGFYSGHQYHEFLKTSDDCDVIWDFLEFLGDHYKGISVYAHNAAGFDNKFIMESLHKKKQTMRFAGGLAKLVWVESDIKFEDSYILLGRNLAACCDAFGVDRKLHWKHEDTQSPWEMGAKLDAFRAYLQRDCISLSDALGAFSQELLTHFGVTPSATMSLTAVKAFDKRFYPVKKINTNSEFEHFIRQATFGGRNEVYTRYGENINLYDVRSMYTSCYDVPVPVGKMLWTSPNLDVGTCAEAIVHVPDRRIGPLPYRHQGRLIFPVGTAQGWWDTRELKKATELGCDVKIIRQLRADEEPILQEFGDYVCNLRKESNRELGKIWKLFGLRLSGKFGQHRLSTEIRHINAIEDFTGWSPIDKYEIYHEAIVSRDGNRSPYVKPAINMRIRSEARIRHLDRLLEADEKGTLYYCDTDSVDTDALLDVGKNPGELQWLDFAVRGYFIRCKFYGYISSIGTLRQRTAGFRDFRLSEQDFQALLEGKERASTFKMLGNWKEILADKGVTFSDRHRAAHSNLRTNNRVTVGLETYPIKLPIKSET